MSAYLSGSGLPERSSSFPLVSPARPLVPAGEARPPFPYRQIHLDFHTSPLIEGIGASFDPDEFAETMAAARVNSATVFAKCHHGLSYYPTKVGITHPHLGRDLMGEQIDALHRRGIRAPIYVSVVWDNLAGEERIDWNQFRPDGSRYDSMPVNASWYWLSMASEYGDYLVAQTEEIISLYGDAVDGFFFDIVMTGNEGDCHPAAIRERERRGLPDTVEGRKRNDVLVARDLMGRLAELCRSRLDDPGLYFNGRMNLDFRDEASLYGQVEIESLPTGGWGYDFYPLWSRYGRRFGLPMLGMTGRFHRSWADFGGLKESVALEFECAGILANGGAISVGDQLEPHGRLLPPVYDTIRNAFSQVEAAEPYCVGSEPVSQVALLINPTDMDATKGASRLLLEAHIQYDTIDSADKLEPYQAIVVPDHYVAAPDFASILESYVANGGSLLVAGGALWAEGKSALGSLDPAILAHPAEITPTYIRPGVLGEELKDFAYVMYDPVEDLELNPVAEVLCERHDALFNRTPERFISHFYAPACESPAASPAIVQFGRVIRIAAPVFGAFDRWGVVAYRKLVIAALKRLIGKPLLETTAPANVEVTVRQQTTANRLIIHAVSFAPSRKGQFVEVIAEPVTLGPIRFQLNRPVAVRTVRLVPNGSEIPFTRLAASTEFTLPSLTTSALLCLELE